MMIIIIEEFCRSSRSLDTFDVRKNSSEDAEAARHTVAFVMRYPGDAEHLILHTPSISLRLFFVFKIVTRNSLR